jgi:hypothetical protein
MVAMIYSLQAANIRFCLNDNFCYEGKRCVLFQCKTNTCQNDADCVDLDNHYCRGQISPFTGTKCILFLNKTFNL